MKSPVDNIVFVHGGSFENVKKALQQWCDAYKLNVEFHLHKNGRGEHIVTTENNIDLEHFEYLVNYLKYPENIQLNAKIIGYKIVDENMRMLFIPDNDTEYDCVYWTNEKNQTFKSDFGGKITKQTVVVPFEQMTEIELEDYNIKVKPKKSTGEKELEIELPKIQKRFKYLVWISSSLIALSSISLLINRPTAIPINACSLLVTTWFFSDYKMLRNSRYYNYCLGIGVLLTSIAFSFAAIKALNESKFALYMSLSAIILLVNQRLLRKLFLKIFKREPVVEKPSPSWKDMLYAMSLLLATGWLTIFLILTFIK
jgi:hypothetical protein